MKKRRFLIFSIFVLATCFLVGILFIDNKKQRIALSRTELRLREKELELHAITWSMKKNYEFNNNGKLDSSILIKDDESVLSEFPRVYYKFALTDCKMCIEAELNNIKKTSSPIFILIETYSVRNFRKFVQLHKLNALNTLRINKPLFEAGEEPFYFVMDKGLMKDLFFPLKERPNLSIEYIQIIQKKYSI